MGLVQDASSDFVRINDLDGRNVVIFPTGIGTAQGDNGKPYQYLTGDVIVLDGPPHELIESIPGVVYNMRFTSGPLVGNGDKALKRAAATGSDALPFGGRINSQKGKFNNLAFGIGTWTDQDAKVKELAETEAQKYLDAKAKAPVTDATDDDWK